MDNLKAKAATGLFIAKSFFQNTIAPKARELGDRTRQAIKELLSEDGASFEATLQAKHAALLREGLTAKEADEAIEKIVKRTLKTKKEKGGTKDE